MIVYRLSKLVYCRDLSGRGAEMSGGRWNSKGIPLIYTSQSRALCMVEVAVHIPFGILPMDYGMVQLELPKNTSVLTIDEETLPMDWQSLPGPHSTQAIGDNFVKEGKALVLKVPSAVVQGDFNYLVNPLHRDIREVKVTDVKPFYFDERLFHK